MRPPSQPASPSSAEEELPFSGELRRKALHLLALVVPLGMGWLGREGALWVLLPLATLAVTADVLRARSEGFHAFIDRVFGGMMRPQERPGPGGPIVLNGATWVLVSATLLTLLFPVRLGAPALAVAMVADAAAALVGRRLGRHPWPGGRRTLEGSLAFFVTGLPLCLALGIALPAAILGVLLATLAEALPGPLNDNLRVPLVLATTLFLFERLPPGFSL